MKPSPSLLFLLLLTSYPAFPQKVFDVHIHGEQDIDMHLGQLKAAGVYKAAISTSWTLQESYSDTPELKLLKGLMLACPNGMVPYIDTFCFETQQDFPELDWVEQNIKNGSIDFIGEVLSQYYGISPSTERLAPFFALAEKHHLPVGIHTGIAGPNHGAPNFRVSLGNPLLLEDLLDRFPKLKVWIMHAGTPFLQESIAIMKYYPLVYADISAISNPYIFPPAEFQSIMRQLMDAGLEDRLMFGSDNGDIKLILTNFHALDFLSAEHKEKILYQNAERFFYNP